MHLCAFLFKFWADGTVHVVQLLFILKLIHNEVGKIVVAHISVFPRSTDTISKLMIYCAKNVASYECAFLSA